MSGVEEFTATMARCPLPRNHEVRRLLIQIGEAWLEAEDTTISENEARRWSPVCDAAQALAAALAVTA